MDFEFGAGIARVILHVWKDVSELNYFARKAGFQRLDENYNLEEVI